MITAVVINSLFGCATLDSHQAPASPSGLQATRFAVLLPNSLVPLPSELSGATDRVLGQITRYLAAQGRERHVIEAPEARSLWLASTAEADQSDTVSHDFYGAMKIFARKLGEMAAFDALVVPSLVYRDGRLANRVVKWDGVVRRLPRVGQGEDLGRRAGPKPIPPSLEVSVPVVSLHVMVFDANGELDFENYGGVDLAHSFSLDPEDGAQLQAELRDPVLAKRSFLREGVEIAFDPYLPRDRVGKW